MIGTGDGPGLLAAAQGDVAAFVQVQAVELAGQVGAVGTGRCRP